MTLTVCYAPVVRHDINECAEDLESQDIAEADRFLESIRQTTEVLCADPGLGGRFRSDQTETIRCYALLDFADYLLFYRQEDSALQILRILQGSWECEQFFD